VAAKSGHEARPVQEEALEGVLEPLDALSQIGKLAGGFVGGHAAFSALA
jgi:hypothetical protein